MAPKQGAIPSPKLVKSYQATLCSAFASFLAHVTTRRALRNRHGLGVNGLQRWYSIRSLEIRTGVRAIFIGCSRRARNHCERKTLYRSSESLNGSKMNHQDARYIPQRRLSDKTHRRWQNRFPLWRLALAAVVMAVVGFVFFQLICRYA